jgi:hypothetical protein
MGNLAIIARKAIATGSYSENRGADCTGSNPDRLRSLVRYPLKFRVWHRAHNFVPA